MLRGVFGLIIIGLGARPLNFPGSAELEDRMS